MTKPRWLEGQNDPRLAGLRQAVDEAALEAKFSEPRGREAVWLGVQRPWERRPERRLGVGLTTAALLAGCAITALFFVPAPLFDLVVPVAELNQANETRPPIRVAEIERAPGEPTGQVVHRVLDRGVKVELMPGARLAVEAKGEPKVERGPIRFHVPKQSSGTTYAVRVGDHRVVVIGTVFVVSMGSAETITRSTVLLEEGVIEVRRLDGTLARRMVAGEIWSSAKPSEEPREEPREEPKANPKVGRPVASAPPPRVAARATPRSPQAVLAEARAAYAAGDLLRTSLLYERLAAGDGPIGDTALHELGTIYMKRGMPQLALRTFEQHRRRFPSGLARPETDLSIIDLLSRTGDGDRALIEARSFLRRFPDNERRAEIASIAGDLERDRDNCQAANQLYDLALGGRLPAATRDDAVFFRAHCHAKLDPTTRVRAMQMYLEEFPTGRHVSAAKAEAQN